MSDSLVSALRDEVSTQRARISELEDILKSLRSSILDEGELGDEIVDSGAVNEAISSTVSSLRGDNVALKARISKLENCLRSLRSSVPGEGESGDEAVQRLVNSLRSLRSSISGDFVQESDGEIGEVFASGVNEALSSMVSAPSGGNFAQFCECGLARPLFAVGG
jgi:prefoldin subunit 5